MESLSDSLKKRLDKRGLDGVLTAATLLEIAKRVVPNHVIPKSLHSGVMWVEVSSGSEAYFFKQEIEDYIERINAAIGQEVVTSIRIRTTHNKH